MIFLSDYLQELKDYEIRGDANIAISGITSNSEEIRPGFIFVAIPGFKFDGKDFVEKAVLKGAAAIVFEGKFFDKLKTTQIRVSGARLALARLSCMFYGHPTEAFYLAGVTGTNGKTTLTYLLEALWQTSGQKTGVMGTVNHRFAKTVFQAYQTTPESRELQRFFSEMRSEKVKKVCMEVSSHGIDLGRVEGCQFDSAVFTNLTQDHLDYHKTLENYYHAKEKLFVGSLRHSSKKDRLAVICTEDRFGKRLLKTVDKIKLKRISYGFKKNNDIYPVSLKMSLAGFKAHFKGKLGDLKIDTPLIGEFNVLNTLAAVAVGLHSGLTTKEIQKALKNFKGVPGRLEQIKDSRGRIIFIDYAHTPDALKNVVMTLKKLASKQVITVFGCGGDRDKSKRSKMGYQAALFSDVCIVTNDNPRTEDPNQIIREILPGIRRAGKKYLIEPDRKAAIGVALKMAKKGDLVLIAGKGHENYQIFGTTKHHFSDKEVVEELIEE